jgi:hypothetical protein
MGQTFGGENHVPSFTRSIITHDLSVQKAAANVRFLGLEDIG